jgi:hypothetical protein
MLLCMTDSSWLRDGEMHCTVCSLHSMRRPSLKPGLQAVFSSVVSRSRKSSRRLQPYWYLKPPQRSLARRAYRYHKTPTGHKCRLLHTASRYTGTIESDGTRGWNGRQSQQSRLPKPLNPMFSRVPFCLPQSPIAQSRQEKPRCPLAL